MSQESGFWPTNGTGHGPSGGYSTEQWQTLLAALFTSDQAATQAVLKGYNNELAVSGSSSPLSVATGAAVVNGLWYMNTAPVSVTVPTPSIGTTGHRVVLRADYTLQTVEIVLLSSADGVSALPALTQNTSRWEVTLATLTITTGGVIALTDARQFCEFATVPQDASVTAFKIADNAVTTAKIADGSVSTAKIGDLNVTTAKIANGAVDHTKVGNGVPMLTKRVGGDAEDWGIDGSTVYVLTSVRMLAGAYSNTFSAASSGSEVITIPPHFNQRPLFFVTGMFNLGVHLEGIANDAEQATIVWWTLDGSTITTISFQWLAVGE